MADVIDYNMADVIDYNVASVVDYNVASVVDYNMASVVDGPRQSRDVGVGDRPNPRGSTAAGALAGVSSNL